MAPSDAAEFPVHFNGQKYDLKKFLRDHPGGANTLEKYRGKSVVQVMKLFGHSTSAYHMLGDFKVDTDLRGFNLTGKLSENGRIITNAEANRDEEEIAFLESLEVDIFAHDLMVIPVHLGVHWCLSLVDFREKRISYLDSMGSTNQACLDALLQYLCDEHQDKKGQPFDVSGWKTENLKEIPQQMNGSDCGMFACTFAEFSCRGARYSFSQAHMPALRRQAALEILQARLLL